MNPSGGILWHWHAWRHRPLWKHSCDDIAQWLAQAPSGHHELLLIGASAGWMMDSAWLQRFAQIDTYDLDRLAGPLFRRNHGAALRASGTVLRCHRADAFSDLGSVLREHPKALVLLDNVLGQLRFHYPDVDEASHRVATVARKLQGRHWGSVHDAYSGPVRTPCSARPRIAMARQQKQARAQSGQSGVPQRAAFAKFGSQLDADGAWLDHLTDDVFAPGTWVNHIAWPYSDDYCHWLQAAWVAPAGQIAPSKESMP